MVVKYNALQNLEVPKFMLCNPGSVYNNGLVSNVVGMLTDHEAEEFVFNFNSTSELNLRINRVTRDNVDENTYTYNLYKSIQNRRLIFAENVGYFMITNIEDGYDGKYQYKDVTAKSIDIEISQKMIPYIENGTYKFTSNATNTSKGIIETIVETLPLWTIGHIDSAVANKWRTFEDIDTSLNCLGFMLENLQDAYECIFIFDCINRVINVYSQDNYIHQTDIHITKDDLINSLDITENADDVYTAIRVLGDENLTIGAVNPLGTGVIYNFDYYLTWMSGSLGDKVKSWQALVKSKESTYYDLNLEYYERLTEASELQMEYDKFASQIKMYTRCRDNIVASEIVDKNNNLVAGYNEVIEENGGTPVVIYEDISKTIASIDELIDECERQQAEVYNNLSEVNDIAETHKNNISKISKELSITDYFTEAEYTELCLYIFEGDYTDEYVIVTDSMSYAEKFEQMKILYDRAQERLERVSQPKQEFTIDVENFVFAKEFERWSEQLETGCLINVELYTNDVALLFLSNITINYDDRKLSMTFGNRFDKFDPKSLFEDMLGDISKSANTLSYLKEILYPIKSGEFNYMKEALQTSRNLSMNAALSSSGEEVIIDDSGYTGKKLLANGEYDPRQVKLTGSSLVFTDDTWDSCKVAIGEILLGDGNSVYGVNAETIIGDVIVGNTLRIVNKDGKDAFAVLDDKIESSVSDIDGRLTTITQESGKIELRVKAIEESTPEVDHVTTTTGYTFGSNGLNIHKDGEEIQNLLNNNGMYVKRLTGNDEEVVLSATNEGVDAINLTSRQYLIVGENSRFENYSYNGDTKRTACFYIGE